MNTGRRDKPPDTLEWLLLICAGVAFVCYMLAYIGAVITHSR